MTPRSCSSFLRRQAVAFELGINRHTLARLIKGDPTFPRFFAISAGIEVIERQDFERWLQRKRAAARMNDQHAPGTHLLTPL